MRFKERSPTWKSKLSTADQRVFNALYGSLHRTFVDIPILSQMGKCSVFTPKFKRQEKLFA